MLFNTVRGAILLTFACLLVATKSASAQKFPQHIPIIRSENLLYVKAYINGRGPFNFRLDLGASTIGRIDNRLAKELGLNVVGFEENSIGTIVKRAFLVGVDKFSVGQITHSNLKLVVQDFNIKPKQMPVNGIIGRDFFYNYLLTIDGPNRQMIVSQDKLDAQAKGVLTYTKAFVVSGKVGSKDMLFNLDTGSNLSLNFPKDLLAGNHYTNTPNQRVVENTNTTFVLQEAVLHDEIVLGLIRVSGQKVYYSDKTHQINVGEDFLEEHVITFDQRKKLVRIE